MEQSAALIYLSLLLLIQALEEETVPIKMSSPSYLYLLDLFCLLRLMNSVLFWMSSNLSIKIFFVQSKAIVSEKDMRMLSVVAFEVICP